MVKIYTCNACTENRHKDCELSKPSYPPGSYGGSRCLCACRGNPHFNDPDVIHRDIMRQLDKITKFEEASKNVSPLMTVKGKPKKSLSEMADELFPSANPTSDEIENAYLKELDSQIKEESKKLKPLSTYQQIRILKDQIEEAQRKIKKIQDKCKHPKTMHTLTPDTFPTKYMCTSCRKEWWELE